MTTFLIVVVVMVVLTIAYAKGTGMKLKKGGRPRGKNSDLGSNGSSGIT